MYKQRKWGQNVLSVDDLSKISTSMKRISPLHRTSSSVACSPSRSWGWSQTGGGTHGAKVTRYNRLQRVKVCVGFSEVCIVGRKLRIFPYFDRTEGTSSLGRNGIVLESLRWEIEEETDGGTEEMTGTYVVLFEWREGLVRVETLGSEVGGPKDSLLRMWIVWPYTKSITFSATPLWPRGNGRPMKTVLVGVD